MARIRWSAQSGTLTADMADSDTTMESAELADFPEVVSPDIAVVILDPLGLTGSPEIAYITAHTAAATTATVTRGKETWNGGAVAREHLTGVTWRHGPTPLDAVSSNVLRYHQGGTQGGNQFNNLPDLFAAKDAAVGPVTIVLDSEDTDPDFTTRKLVDLTGGPYDFTDVTFTSDYPATLLTFLINDGATFNFRGQFGLAGGVVMRGAADLTAYACTLDGDATYTVALDNGCICNDSTGGGAKAIFGLPNNNTTLAFVVHHEGGLYNGENVATSPEGAYEVAESTGTGNIFFITTASKAVVTDDVFRGAVAFFAYRVGSSSVRYPTITNANLTAGIDGSLILSQADKVKVNATPTNYTPDDETAEGHLGGIDDALGIRATIINTDSDPGTTIYVGTVDPDGPYSPVAGDVWLDTST